MLLRRAGLTALAGLSCTLHHALNDLVARSFASAGVPVTKEPMGLYRTDGKRPDGITLVPWQSGKSLCWDVTVTCPLAESYIDKATLEEGASARHLLDDLGRRISENTGEA